jgi:hypothetical protein
VTVEAVRADANVIDGQDLVVRVESEPGVQTAIINSTVSRSGAGTSADTST